jgi:hypothetical protein
MDAAAIRRGWRERKSRRRCRRRSTACSRYFIAAVASFREEVIGHVWPDAAGAGVSEQAVDALVRRLRDRLAELDPDGAYIVTVRGHGFRLDNPAA